MRKLPSEFLDRSVDEACDFRLALKKKLVESLFSDVFGPSIAERICADTF
jgi:hypothetical protein